MGWNFIVFFKVKCEHTFLGYGNSQSVFILPLLIHMSLEVFFREGGRRGIKFIALRFQLCAWFYAVFFGSTGNATRLFAARHSCCLNPLLLWPVSKKSSHEISQIQSRQKLDRMNFFPWHQNDWMSKKGTQTKNTVVKWMTETFPSMVFSL